MFRLKYLNFVAELIENKRTNAFLKKTLSELEFDLVIFRYGMANYFFYRLAKYFKYKFVFEHNTNEIEQYKLKYKSPIISDSWITYNFFSEKIFRA